MVKVSVIIPVYNGEKHLRQCLDSVCNQTLQEIEIICVDDGSTDSSLDILKEYREKDSRITILQQKNLYAGVARNNGKAHATGEYLVFWDCDDFFELEALELMYQKASEVQADVCVCGGNQYLEEKDATILYNGYLNPKRIPQNDVFNRNTNELYILNFTNEAAWNKMFQREFVERMEIDFQAVRNGNDIYFTANALCLADKITIVEKPLINYRKNQSQSLVGSLTKSPITPFQAWMDVAENLISKGAFPERSFVNKVVGSSVYLLRRIQTKEALVDTLSFLKNDGLSKLHIEVRDKGYYFNAWHEEYVQHLVTDSIEEFQMYLSNSTYTQLTETGAKKRLVDQKIKEKNKKIAELKEKNKKIQNKNIELQQKNMDLLKTQKELQKRIDKIESSWSYRIGRIIVWLPGKVKRIFKRK